MRMKKKITQYIICIVAGAIISSCGFVEETDFLPANYKNSDWWNTDWSNRRQLTFNNSGQSEALQNFPVLVKLNSSRIDYFKTQDSGQDIRFIDANGTELKYEIEEWDEGGESYVWVKVPQIDALSNTDYIWMYYGNDTVGDGQDAANVWDSNYTGIWHLKETGATFFDSTDK